jgi:hypothetical protein
MTQPNQSTLSRKWAFEINTGTVGVPIWTPVKGLTSFKESPFEPNLEDDNVYEDNGYTGQTKTGLSWSIEAKVMRRTDPTDVTVYDPGQQACRARAKTLGATGVAYVRWYDRNGGPEAYTGFGEVSWVPEGGESTDLEAVTITVTGKGAPTEITNPNAPALALPTITAILPTGGSTAGGTLVKITGTDFMDRNGNIVVTGATGVQFGGTNATSYYVDDRQTIYAIAPAHAAGSVQTKVTNTTGASVDVAADNYLYA